MSVASEKDGAGNAVVVLAPAKLNLSLELLGRRADGYHELATHVLAIDRYDELTLRVEPWNGDRRETPEVSFHLESSDPNVPGDGTNLAVQALRLVLGYAVERGFDAGVRFDLELKKALPCGAGLGGGSSDAAAAFYAGALLCGFDPDGEEAQRRLASLGSDVAFFLRARGSGFARCTGRGEQVEALAAPAGLHFAVVTPRVHVPTADVYGAVTGPFRKPASFDLARFLGGSLEERRHLLRNDLEEPAMRVVPALRSWAELLNEAPGGPWRLSGSGSTFFALFADAERAQAALEDVRDRAIARDYGRNLECTSGAAGSGVRRGFQTPI